jgi:hypothetical protein
MSDLEHVWLYTARHGADDNPCDLWLPRRLAEAIVLYSKMPRDDFFSGPLWVLLFVEYGIDKWTLNETTWEIRDTPSLEESIEEDRKRYERFKDVTKTNRSNTELHNYMNTCLQSRFKHFKDAQGMRNE